MRMNGMGTLAISAMAMVVLVLICLCANLQGTGGTPDSLLSRANGDAVVPTSSIVDLLTAQQLSSKARKVQDRLNKAKKSAFAVADQILTDFPSQAGKRGPEVPDPHPDPDPFPYPGHPARSPASVAQNAATDGSGSSRTPGLALKPISKQKLKPAVTHKKTLRQDREGIVASPQLGRMHGCQPEQITIIPSDDCDPLAAKMQPAVDHFHEHMRAEQNDNFAGVHWTSGDVAPGADAFPYYERHGGYSGFGFNDIIYDSEKGVHPTLYKPTVNWGMGRLITKGEVVDDSHHYTTGTSFFKGRRGHSLSGYGKDNKHIALLIAEGQRDLQQSKTASPERAAQLLEDASADFKAARNFKVTPPAAHAHAAARRQVAVAGATATGTRGTSRGRWSHAQIRVGQPSSARVGGGSRDVVDGGDGGRTGGVFMRAVDDISAEAADMRALDDSISMSDRTDLARLRSEMRGVKEALGSLDGLAHT